MKRCLTNVGKFKKWIQLDQNSLYSTSCSSNFSLKCYLVDSLGFSNRQAVSISKKLSKRKKKIDDQSFGLNATAVVNLFKIQGFNDTLIRKVVNVSPRCLTYDVDKTLNPKFRFFREQGFSESDIVRVVSMNDRICNLGVESVLLPTFRILGQFLGGCTSNDSRVIKIVTNSRRSFHAIHKFLLPNVDSLRSYGIPIEVIRKHVVQLPGTYVRNPESFKDIMVKVENKLGISRHSPGFLNGIELLCRFREETLESKCRLFRTFGWTQSDLDTFIVTHTICFTFSEAHIKKKFDFLINEVQYKPAQLISCSSRFLLCSLEKTMVPRHKVLLILKEKGLLNKKFSFRSAVQLSERQFLRRFVIPFKKVHRIYVKHTGCNLKMLTQQSAISIS